MKRDNFFYLKKEEKIKVHGTGGNGRYILIEFDSLPKKYQDEVRKLFGDPKKYVVTQPIKALVQTDLRAEQFYRDYTLPNGMKLPDQDFDIKGKTQINYVAAHTKAASYLNTIIYLIEDKRALKEQLNVSITTFWERIFDLLKAEKVRLPLSEKRLKITIKEYKGQNYGCLVEAFRFGNPNAKKVDDDVAESLLIEMIGHDHQHDYSRIAIAYNTWAKDAGKKTISERAVAYWAKKNAYLITQNREGKSINYNKFNKQIRRDRPSAPLLLINSDDNVLDLYFIEEKVNKKNYVVKNHYYRPVLYVVVDAFNDYILGYAVGETVTIELIKEAYRNAESHVKQLLNGYYLPHQIQTDRWGLGKDNELEKFYKSMGEFTPATARVAQGKYIERTFGTTWHQELKRYINYAGQNVTAKEKLNPDAIDRNKSNFPVKSESVNQVAEFIERLRSTKRKDCELTRREEWMTAFASSEISKKRQISTEQHLQIFGKLHNPKNGRKNRLLPQGLEIMNGKFLYDIPASYFPYHVNKEVQVIYDPYDMNQVLVTDGKGLRFVANSYVKSPSALADHTEHTQAIYWNRMHEKKTMAAVPGEAQSQRRELLERAKIDAESLLQGGVLVKQIRHDAEKAVKGAFDDFEDMVQHKRTELVPNKDSFLDRW
ncbi:MAG: hypothetical protein H7289_07695 [Mucilaginibacter sp.]|nr:hypothetical protein [Mucilaginibacter sp.]